MCGSGAQLVFPRSRDSRLSSEQWSYLVPATRYSYQHQGGIHRRQKEVVYNLDWANCNAWWLEVSQENLFYTRLPRAGAGHSGHYSPVSWHQETRTIVQPTALEPDRHKAHSWPGCLVTGPQSESECGEARCDDHRRWPHLSTPPTLSKENIKWDNLSSVSNTK